MFQDEALWRGLPGTKDVRTVIGKILQGSFETAGGSMNAEHRGPLPWPHCVALS